jgi:hypothetical protein
MDALPDVLHVLELELTNACHAVEVTIFIIKPVDFPA